MIAIIGSGLVGSSIAFLCASNSLTDIVLLNRTKSKAKGEALDISNAIPRNSDIMVSGTDDYRKIKDEEIIVIAASTGIYQKNRNEIIHAQVKMIKSIAKKIKKHCSSPTILMVSNPVDVLTYFFQKEIRYPREKVIGIASSLDSSRFRHIISCQTKAKYSTISDVHVLGEHGDSMVPVFSKAKVNGKRLSELINPEQAKKIRKDVCDYWKSLRNFKSRSQFGIAKNVYNVLDAIVKNHQVNLEASVLLRGEFGQKDICMGMPVKISINGIEKIKSMKLDSSEIKLLEESARTIRKNIQSVK